MKIDKQNGEVAFNEELHKYFNVKDPNRNYTSVTTLIGKYYPHFDEEFWSRYKALQELVGEDEFDGPNFKPDGKRTPASKAKIDLLNKKKYDHTWTKYYDLTETEVEILAAKNRAKYLEANRVANERGTAYHNLKENKFYTKSEFEDTELKEITPHLNINGNFNCIKGDFDLSRDKAVLPEYLVYFSDKDNILHLAGQMDLLIKDGNDIYILDYKTNADGMKTEAYQYFDAKKKKKVSEKMFFPINNLDNHMFNHYQLQLSIYAWMLQRINPNFNIKLLMLLHIDGNGVETEYEVTYLKEDVERLLKDYKKQLVIKARRNDERFD